MASLRTTSRLVASSRSLFRPATFARSYATVESAQVRSNCFISTGVVRLMSGCVGARAPDEEIPGLPLEPR